jgi:hypothetical protein
MLGVPFPGPPADGFANVEVGISYKCVQMRTSARRPHLPTKPTQKHDEVYHALPLHLSLGVETPIHKQKRCCKLCFKLNVFKNDVYEMPKLPILSSKQHFEALLISIFGI